MQTKTFEDLLLIHNYFINIRLTWVKIQSNALGWLSERRCVLIGIGSIFTCCTDLVQGINQHLLPGLILWVCKVNSVGILSDRHWST